MPKTVVDNGQSWDLNRDQMNELILKPVFVSDNVFNSTFKVKPNVKGKIKLHYLSTPSKFIQNNDDCNFNPKGAMSLTPGYLDVKRKKIQMEQCKDELFDTCLEIALTGSGNRIFEPGATPEDAVLQKAMAQVVSIGIQNDLMLLASFSKPGQTISVPGSTDFYDVDSEFQQGLFPNLVKYVADGKLTQINAGSGSALSSGESVVIFQALWNNRSLVFKGLESQIGAHEIHCTQSIADNYREYLESLGTYEQYTVLTNGIARLTWRGIVIVPHPEWDAELRNPLVFNLTEPHRAILTVAGNMQVATDLSASDVSLRIYTDVHQLKVYTAGYLRFGGANLAHPELAVYGA